MIWIASVSAFLAGVLASAWWFMRRLAEQQKRLAAYIEAEARKRHNRSQAQINRYAKKVDA